MPYFICDAYAHRFPIKTLINLGSGPQNQIILSDALAAPVHASIFEKNGSLFIRDENSPNGTFVNQVRIVGETPLKAGDQIKLADTPFTIEYDPEPGLPPAAPRKKKGFKSCCLSVLMAFGILLVLLLAMGGIGYYLVQSGTISLESMSAPLLTLIGMGPSQLDIENLSDNTVYVQIIYLPHDGSAPINFGNEWEIPSFGSQTRKDFSNADKYIVKFGSTSQGDDLGTCHIAPQSGQRFLFIVLSNMVIINRTEYPDFLDKAPENMMDLVVISSSLCR
ncbi:MAG: FHA domain-containing protein [Anaerolineae bacterium]|nr:FHA domain-containing protein [Anaerolineae bacterium]